MYMKQFYMLGQVSLHSFAVVHVHEFRWNEPDSEPAWSKPGIGEKQKVTIEAGQAADADAEVSMDATSDLLTPASPVRRSRAIGGQQHIRRVGRIPGWFARSDG